MQHLMKLRLVTLMIRNLPLVYSVFVQLGGQYGESQLPPFLRTSIIDHFHTSENILIEQLIAVTSWLDALVDHKEFIATNGNQTINGDKTAITNETYSIIVTVSIHGLFLCLSDLSRYSTYILFALS